MRKNRGKWIFLMRTFFKRIPWIKKKNSVGNIWLIDNWFKNSYNMKNKKCDLSCVLPAPLLHSDLKNQFNQLVTYRYTYITNGKITVVSFIHNFIFTIQFPEKRQVPGYLQALACAISVWLLAPSFSSYNIDSQWNRSV